MSDTDLAQLRCSPDVFIYDLCLEMVVVGSLKFSHLSRDVYCYWTVHTFLLVDS